MPTNLAARPLGRVASQGAQFLFAVVAGEVRMKGLEAPALELSVPAVTRAGAKGRWPGVLAQPLPSGPELTLKSAVGWASGTSGVPQGTRSLVVLEAAAGDRGRQRRPWARP